MAFHACCTNRSPAHRSPFPAPGSLFCPRGRLAAGLLCLASLLVVASAAEVGAHLQGCLFSWSEEEGSAVVAFIAPVIWCYLCQPGLLSLPVGNWPHRCRSAVEEALAIVSTVQELGAICGLLSHALVDRSNEAKPQQS